LQFSLVAVYLAVCYFCRANTATELTNRKSRVQRHILSRVDHRMK